MTLRQPPLNDLDERHEETLADRLIRIETRIVKIMEALNLDPRTGQPKRNRPSLRRDEERKRP